MGTLIKKHHILISLFIVCLYLMVGGWKIYSNSKEQVQVITAAEEADRQQIVYFWDLFNEATDRRVQGDYESAIEKYSAALSLNSEHEDALYYLGNMHLFQRNFEKTEVYFKKLEKLNPNSPRTQLQLGTLYSCMDSSNQLYDLDGAYARFLNAWNLNREETGAPLMLAKIYLLQEDYENAGELIRAITLSNKMSYQALFLQGYLEWKLGEGAASEKIASDARNLYLSLAYTDVQGEGATAAGARAMLSDDRFCDRFETIIQELLSYPNTRDLNQLYRQLYTSIKLWQKNEF